jgi:hypothetical protein
MIRLRRTAILADLKLASVRRLAKGFLEIETRQMQSRLVHGIEVHFRSPEFLSYTTRAMDGLRDQDSSLFSGVVKHVHALVELGPKHWAMNGNSAYQYGLSINTYFDEWTQPQRHQFGEARYACILARMAALIRIIDDFGISAAWDSNWKFHERVLRIGFRRELHCCHQLGCKGRDIYPLQRWLRNNT